MNTRNNNQAGATPAATDGLRIGWAAVDIVPPQPVLIAGQFHARVSEGVADPLTATALALQANGDQAVLVSCDLVAIGNELRDAVRAIVRQHAPDLPPEKVVLNATHTHTAPEIRAPSPTSAFVSRGTGVELPAMPAADYVAFAAQRIGAAVIRAWQSRAPGTIAFGQGYAVIGRNRRWVDTSGRATMYGNTNTPSFSHIEGYEDHSVNILATCDMEGALTGLVVNVPCPAQVSESEFVLSADYWHETRNELRRRFGDALFVLAQCSAAGDQSPHLLFEKAADQRMLNLRRRSRREEIAQRLADAVSSVLPVTLPTAQPTTAFRHHVETIDLPLNRLTPSQVDEALREAASWQARYEEELRKLAANPALRQEPRWYVPVTRAFQRMEWYRAVARRFEEQASNPYLPVEVHVIRLGDVAIATNPFEYYLDFGIFIKARSCAVQTFLVQLAGPGTYVPSARAVAGGSYGAVPASNLVGPEGGRHLAERTVEIIQELWRS